MQEREYRLVVIGGSAGSIDAVLRIIPALSHQFTIPVILVLHRKPSSHGSLMSELLQKRTTLQVKEADEKEPIAPATIYLAPADYHLLIEQDYTFSLDASEKIHFSRPSIDVTFESASEKYGQHLVGILLTGANTDGAQGIADIADNGGLTIAQNPDTAEVDTMPLAAIRTGKVEQVQSIEEIVAFLNSLVK